MLARLSSMVLRGRCAVRLHLCVASMRRRFRSRPHHLRSGVRDLYGRDHRHHDEPDQEQRDKCFHQILGGMR